MIREMKKLSRKNKGKRPNRIEKTIQIVKETEFVQKDEFNNVSEPMPDVTLRQIKQLEKEENREEQNEQVTANKRTITINRFDTQDDGDVNDETPEITEPLPEKSNESDDDVVNITDIREARKKEKSKKRLKKFIAVLIVIILAGATYLTRNLWVPKLEGILDRPKNTIVNDGKTQKGNFPIEIDNASQVKITDIDNHLVGVDKNHILLYDENGELVNSFSHTYADPVIKTASKRMLLYDNGGTSFELFTRKKELFTKDVGNPILYASIANNSNVAVVTQSVKYECCLSIYDNNGSEIYKWETNSRITDVSFTNSGTSCYVSAFRSEKGAICSVIYRLDFDSTEVSMSSEKLDTLALKVTPTDNGGVWVVGDDRLYRLDDGGKILLNFDYNGEIIDYATDSKAVAVVYKGVGRKKSEVVFFKSDSDSTEPVQKIETDGGLAKKLKYENGKFVLLKENTIEAYDISGNKSATAEVSSDYNDFAFFGQNVYFLGCREINKISFKTE